MLSAWRPCMGGRGIERICLMSKRLHNKRCLIVGGTTGLGFAAARRFMEEGAALVVAGRSAAKGAAALAELQALGEVQFVACDASDAGQVDELYRQTAEWLGGLDVLYHVAGI